MINTLNDDINANANLDSSFSYFLEQIYSYLNTWISNNNYGILVPANISNFWSSFILNSGIGGTSFTLLRQFLLYKVYAYETLDLLNMWNGMSYKIATQLFLKLYKKIAIYISQNQLALAQLTNYGTNGITSTNSTQSNNLSSTSTNDTTGQVNISNTVTSQSNTTLPASNLTLTVNDVDSSQNNNTSTTYNGYEIVDALEKIGKDVDAIVTDIFEEVFKPFFAPFMSVDSAIKKVGF